MRKIIILTLCALFAFPALAQKKVTVAAAKTNPVLALQTFTVADLQLAMLRPKSHRILPLRLVTMP